MSRQMIVIAKDYAGEEYEFPDVYPVDGDSKSDCDRERAVALMGMLYHSYLETEEKESSIPIDHKRSYYSETEAYGQIAWENGAVHRYFLTGTQDLKKQAPARRISMPPRVRIIHGLGRY